MALKPVAWMKIYTPGGNYAASCNDEGAAAALMAFYGDGAEIRNGHSKKNVIWREGSEQQPAGESYDFVTYVISERMTPIEPATDPEQDKRVQAGLDQTKATVLAMLSANAT